MVLPNSTDRQSLRKGEFERRRFTRRHDLTSSIRLAIATEALHAMMNGVWGTITQLADEYKVSRPFVYSLARALKEAGRFFLGKQQNASPPPLPENNPLR